MGQAPSAEEARLAVVERMHHETRQKQNALEPLAWEEEARGISQQPGTVQQLLCDMDPHVEQCRQESSALFTRIRALHSGQPQSALPPMPQPTPPLSPALVAAVAAALNPPPTTPAGAGDRGRGGRRRGKGGGGEAEAPLLGGGPEP